MTAAPVECTVAVVAYISKRIKRIMLMAVVYHYFCKRRAIDSLRGTLGVTGTFPLGSGTLPGNGFFGGNGGFFGGMISPYLGTFNGD